MQDLIIKEQEMEKAMMRKYEDEIVDNTTISVSRQVETEEEAINLARETLPGEYISVVNKNNLGQVFIYQRNVSQWNIKEDCIWDGKSYDTSWYHEGAELLQITNAAELKGLYQLVADGITFEGVEVRLEENINLDRKPWIPIGRPYKLVSDRTDDHPYTKYSVTPSEYCFKGRFNGNGKLIANLYITEEEMSGGFGGFFLSIQHAEIINVMFRTADLRSDDPETNFAIVAGFADNSIFTNVIVSGDNRCAKPSGICGIARDTAFYGCKNLATLTARTSSPAGLVAGGLCEQLTISKNMITSLEGKAPRLFMNCVNEGYIRANGRHAKYVWLGNFFGGTYYETDVGSFSFIMDHCTIRSGTDISLEYSDMVEGEVVFFGYRDGFANGQTNNVAETSKDDLMDGLIGRVDQCVGIEVRKLTSSKKIDNLVIPGSINTLVSNEGENTFHTVIACRATLEESIYDLEPYFRFVKAAKK